MVSKSIIATATLFILLSLCAYAYTEDDVRSDASSVIRENLTSTDKAIDYLLIEALTLEKAINRGDDYIIPESVMDTFNYRITALESRFVQLGDPAGIPIVQRLDEMENQVGGLNMQTRRIKANLDSLQARINARQGFNLFYALGTFFQEVGNTLIGTGENPAPTLIVPKTLQPEPQSLPLDPGEILLTPIQAKAYDAADGHPIGSALDSNPDTYFSRNDKPNTGSPLDIDFTFDRPVSVSRIRLRSVKSAEDLLPGKLHWRPVYDTVFGGSSSGVIPILTNGQTGDVTIKNGDTSSVQWNLFFESTPNGGPMKIQFADIYFYGRYGAQENLD